MWLVMLLLICWLDAPWFVQAAFAVHTILLILDFIDDYQNT